MRQSRTRGDCWQTMTRNGAAPLGSPGRRSIKSTSAGIVDSPNANACCQSRRAANRAGNRDLRPSIEISSSSTRVNAVRSLGCCAQFRIECPAQTPTKINARRRPKFPRRAKNRLLARPSSAVGSNADHCGSDYFASLDRTCEEPGPMPEHCGEVLSKNSPLHPGAVRSATKTRLREARCERAGFLFVLNAAAVSLDGAMSRRLTSALARRSAAKRAAKPQL